MPLRYDLGPRHPFQVSNQPLAFRLSCVNVEMLSAQYEGKGFSLSQQTELSQTQVKRHETGLVPLTVKQISEASVSADDKSILVIDGVDVSNIKLVGLVHDKIERVTDVAFTLDDGTGRINCMRWLNEASDKKEIEDVENEMFVRVCGRLKSNQGKRQLVAFSIRPVINFDEISFHFIESIHFHLQNCGAKFQGNVSTESQTGMVLNSSQNASEQNGSNGVQHSMQFSLDGLKGFDQMVLDYLQQPSNFDREKGVHRDEICQKLKVPVEKIMESIRVLEEEGLIYSTIDEFHFKSTSC